MSGSLASVAVDVLKHELTRCFSAKWSGTNRVWTNHGQTVEQELFCVDRDLRKLAKGGKTLTLPHVRSGGFGMSRGSDVFWERSDVFFA